MADFAAAAVQHTIILLLRSSVMSAYTRMNWRYSRYPLFVCTRMRAVKGLIQANILAYGLSRIDGRVNHRVCTVISPVRFYWLSQHVPHLLGYERREGDEKFLFTARWTTTCGYKGLYFGEVNQRRKMSLAAKLPGCRYASSRCYPPLTRINQRILTSI